MSKIENIPTQRKIMILPDGRRINTIGPVPLWQLSLEQALIDARTAKDEDGKRVRLTIEALHVGSEAEVTKWTKLMDPGPLQGPVKMRTISVLHDGRLGQSWFVETDAPDEKHRRYGSVMPSNMHPEDH